MVLQGGSDDGLNDEFARRRSKRVMQRDSNDRRDDDSGYRQTKRAKSSSGAATLSAQSRKAASSTHPSTNNNDHIDSSGFIKDVNRALKRALSSNASVYRKISVLFIRWEDDELIEPGINNGVQGEIDSLERVFKHDYGFETKTYLIPNRNSHRSLRKRIEAFEEDHANPDELLLVYYGGHGELTDLNQSIWSQGGKGLTVDWSSLQHILEYAEADVVLFLDCCYAASADQRSAHGAIEILAACGREVKTTGVNEWSFTSRLTEILHKLKNQRFTIAQLHQKLVNYQAADGSKMLLNSPNYGLMTNKDKPSVKLSAMTSAAEVTSVEDTHSELSGATSCRVMIRVSIQTDEGDRNVWRDWLSSHLPGEITGLELVRPQFVGGSCSVLALFSLPVAVWDLLPDKPAYTFVGFVTTPNMIRMQTDPADIGVINMIARALTGCDKSLLESHTAEDHSRSTEPTTSTTIKAEDILLAVMGITGSGKSNFIANASGKEVRIGHTLRSTTQQVEIASFHYEGKNVHLIDTPGFDDTSRSDTEVLKEIAYWLSEAYGSNVRLSGIIHLHPITATRMSSSAVNSLDVLRKTWGESILSSVAMVTTMWDIVEPEVGTLREQELKSEFWQPFLKHGSYFSRYQNSQSSALSIVNIFMNKGTRTLEIQHEMVDQHKMLKDTDAGQELKAAQEQMKDGLEHETAALSVGFKQLAAAKREIYWPQLVELARIISANKGLKGSGAVDIIT